MASVITNSNNRSRMENHNDHHANSMSYQEIENVDINIDDRFTSINQCKNDESGNHYNNRNIKSDTDVIAMKDGCRHWREEECFSLSSSTNCFTVVNNNHNHDGTALCGGDRCWNIATLYDSVDIVFNNSKSLSSLQEKENNTLASSNDDKWNVHYHSLPSTRFSLNNCTNNNNKKNMNTSDVVVAVQEKEEKKQKSIQHSQESQKQEKQKHKYVTCTSHCALKLLPRQHHHNYRQPMNTSNPFPPTSSSASLREHNEEEDNDYDKNYNYYYNIEAFALKHDSSAFRSEKNDKNKGKKKKKNDDYDSKDDKVTNENHTNDNEEDNNTTITAGNKSIESSSVKSSSSSTTKGTNKNNSTTNKPAESISIGSNQPTTSFSHQEIRNNDKYSIVVQVVATFNNDNDNDDDNDNSLQQQQKKKKKKKRYKLSKTVQFRKHAYTKSNNTTTNNDNDKNIDETQKCPIVLHLFPMNLNVTNTKEAPTPTNNDARKNKNNDENCCTMFILAITHLDNINDVHERKSDKEATKDNFLEDDSNLSCYVFSIMDNEVCGINSPSNQNSSKPIIGKNSLIYSPIYFLPPSKQPSSSLEHHITNDQITSKLQLFSKIAQIESPIMALSTINIEKYYASDDDNDRSSLVIACACQDGSIRIITTTPHTFPANNNSRRNYDGDFISGVLSSYQLQVIDIAMFQVDGSVVAMEFYAYDNGNKLALAIASLDGFACLYLLDINKKTHEQTGINDNDICLGSKNRIDRSNNNNNNNNNAKDDNHGWKGPFIITKNLCPSILTNYIMDDFFSDNSNTYGLTDSILSLHTFCYSNVINDCRSNDKKNVSDHAIVLGTYSGRVLLYIWNDNSIRSSANDSVESSLLANRQTEFPKLSQSTNNKINLRFQLFWKCQLPYPIHGIATYCGKKRTPINSQVSDLLIVTRRSIHIMRNIYQRDINPYDIKEFSQKNAITTKKRIKNFIDSYSVTEVEK